MGNAFFFDGTLFAHSSQNSKAFSSTKLVPAALKIA